MKKNLRVGVRRGERGNFGDSGGRCAEQKISNVLDVSFLVGVEVGDHSEKDVVEGVLFHAGDGAHAGVDARCGGVLEAGRVDVGGSETEGWETGVDVVEPVVVVGDVELAGVF